MEVHYFITVQWCGKGRRGIFTDRQGSGYWKETPHTEEEMIALLGHFHLILSPESTLLTQEDLTEYIRWLPLAEYQHQFGIAVKEEA
tara:strand:+ start:1409 stop:1669 length:261 start_codon:yes stop_codon:yes gene_type:complete